MLGLSVITALIVACFPMISLSCSMGTSPVPRVSVAVSTDTLTAAAGTKIPLHIYMVNEGAASVSGGSLELALFADKPYKLVNRFSVDVPKVLVAGSVSTTSVLWNIPTALPRGVYSIKGAYVLDGMALTGNRVSRASPFGNAARVFISSEAQGTVAALSMSNLAPLAPWSSDCSGAKGLYDWAMAIGGLGVAMILLIRLSRKN